MVGDSQEYYHSILANSYNYYLLNITEVSEGELIEVTVQEQTIDPTNSLVLLSKVDSCPNVSNTDYGSQSYDGHYSLYYPRTPGTHVIALKSSSLSVVYKIKISIGNQHNYSGYSNDFLRS